MSSGWPFCTGPDPDPPVLPGASEVDNELGAFQILVRLTAGTIRHLMDAADLCPLETRISGSCGWAGNRGHRRLQVAALRRGSPSDQGKTEVLCLARISSCETSFPQGPRWSPLRPHSGTHIPDPSLVSEPFSAHWIHQGTFWRGWEPALGGPQAGHRRRLAALSSDLVQADLVEARSSAGGSEPLLLGPSCAHRQGASLSKHRRPGGGPVLTEIMLGLGLRPAGRGQKGSLEHPVLDPGPRETS